MNATLTADWRDAAACAGTKGEAGEAPVTVDRTPKPCLHPKANHEHGTHLAWRADGCRCWPCCAAYSAYWRFKYHRSKIEGPALVDPTPGREHVTKLRELGWSLETIERVTCTAHRVVQELAYPRAYRPRIKRDTLQRILEIPARPPSLDEQPPKGRYPAIGSRRRVEALATMGWSLNKIASQAGLSNRLESVVRQDYCTVETHRAISDAYDKLWDKQPPTETVAERSAVARTRSWARKRGFAPPMAWDETIDDPAARPNYGQLPDESNTRMDLYQQGLSDGQIGAAVGVSTDAIQKWRTRRNLPSNYYTREGRAS